MNEIESLKQQILDENYKSQQEIGVITIFEYIYIDIYK